MLKTRFRLLIATYSSWEGSPLPGNPIPNLLLFLVCCFERGKLTYNTSQHVYFRKDIQFRTTIDTPLQEIRKHDITLAQSRNLWISYIFVTITNAQNNFRLFYGKDDPVESSAKLAVDEAFLCIFRATSAAATATHATDKTATMAVVPAPMPASADKELFEAEDACAD